MAVQRHLAVDYVLVNLSLEAFFPDSLFALFIVYERLLKYRSETIQGQRESGFTRSAFSVARTRKFGLILTIPSLQRIGQTGPSTYEDKAGHATMHPDRVPNLAPNRGNLYFRKPLDG
jgi:hypothetical protein